MKIRILFLFVTVVLINTSQGQNVITAAASVQDSRSIYQQDLDRFLQYLDKSQIPTGILYDRVPPIAELDTLSGVINNNTNPAIKTSSFHFLQAWQELYNASYNQSSMLKPEWLDALITEKRINNVVPIKYIKLSV